MIGALGVGAGALPAADIPQAWAFDSRSLQPFWNSKTMVGETVLFLQNSNGQPAKARLLFAPTRVLAVRSASGEVVYKAGVDYEWKRGSREIVLPPGSRIVAKTPQDLRRAPKSQPYALTHRDGNGEIMFGASHEYQDLQTCVTYEHADHAWQGTVPRFAGEQLPGTLAKLRAKAPLKIALLGDSISTGCNASGWAKVPPFQPAYQNLVVAQLRAYFGGEVTLTNFAVGGTETGWGKTQVPQLVAAQPDLILLAFGMNDIPGGRSAADYQANIKAMMDEAKKALPAVEFILVASMVGNKDWTIMKAEMFPPYRDALGQLCGRGVALADMTSMWLEFFKVKADWDLTGNGVNHPNDFGHRVYAQVISALLIPAAKPGR